MKGENMKNWVKYIISIIVFFTSYVLMQILFNKSIDWKMTIVATMIYAILDAICVVFFYNRTRLR